MLAARDLVVEIAGRRIVGPLSFDLDRGATVALVGESGSGKSITALALLGLTPPGSVVSGSVTLAGEELLGRGEREWRRVRGRRIGFVFQEPMSALNPVLRVGTQIREVLTAHGLRRGRAARARAVELLGEVLLPDPAAAARAYPHQLSGGQRQRAMLAIALAGEPDILLADEPTTALDVTVQAGILDLLSALASRRDLTILFITHDLMVAAELCRRVLVLYAGELVEDRPLDLDGLGTAASPHPYTAALWGAIPRLDRPLDALVALPGRVPEPGSRPAGCVFAPRCPERATRCEEARPAVFETREGALARCFLFDPVDPLPRAAGRRKGSAAG